MLHISTFGLGQAFAAAPESLTQYVSALRTTPRPAGFGRYYGLEAAFDTFDAFYTSGKTATWTDPTKQAYCRKDSANRPVCWLTSYAPTTAARKGPIATMQRAVDALVNKIPVWHMEVGQKAKITGPDGMTAEKTIDRLPDSPILNSAGYDGVVGDSTGKYALAALILAGALKSIPDTVAAAYIAPHNGNLALYAQGIADYLNNVTDNFASLLSAYKERDRQPATDPFVPATVPALAPYVPQPSSNKGVLIGLAVGGVLLTVGASLAARKAQEERGGSGDEGFATLGYRHRRRSHYRHYRSDW